MTHNTVFATPVNSQQRSGSQQAPYSVFSQRVNSTYQRFNMQPLSQQHIRDFYGSQPMGSQEENIPGSPDLNQQQGFGSQPDGTQGSKRVIWGTTIDEQDIDRDFNQFIEDLHRGGKYYNYLNDVINNGEVIYNVDCHDLSEFNPTLYKKLVQYPSEVLTIFDVALKRIAQKSNPQNYDPDTQQFMVTPYNLLNAITVRELDPKHLDTLIAVKGMVTRVSSIIPELRIACYRCERCGYEFDITNENQRINEPERCLGCHSNNSLQMMHNHSHYFNKQHIKLQESPEQIPEGMTPRSVTLFAVGKTLVDYCKPGDRVVITGIFKAKPMRENPSQRTYASIFKSYVDVIHIHRETNQKLFSVYGTKAAQENRASGTQEEGAEGDISHTPRDQTGNNQDTTPAGTPPMCTPVGEQTPGTSPQPGFSRMQQTQQSQLGQRDVDMGDVGSQNEGLDNQRVHNETFPDTNEGGYQIENYFRAGLKSKEDEIWQFGQSPDVYEQLTASFSPDIWGMEDVKKGILCLLFGGVPKTFGGGKLRGEINTLIVGDPSVSKSQLLSYAHRIAPRGIYTSGGGSSAVGLTAYVAKDPETREMVLESGALVLSDMGVCCIDEFDKMTDTARSMLHEVMEQQTVSIAKVGIISSLNARTSILACANPKESRYDKNLTMVENINLPPTLLSRFDLIYVVLDKTDEAFDTQLAKHLIQQYGTLTGGERNQVPKSAEFLKDYIAFARAKIQPQLSEEAAQELRAGYLHMRQHSAGNKKIVSATPRQLEGAIRLSEALAKMHLSNTVTREHVKEALRLIKESMLQAAINPKTGRIDYDAILTGHTATQKEQMQQISAEVYKILEAKNGSMRKYELMQELRNENQQVRDQDLNIILQQMEGVEVENGKVTLVRN